MVGREAAVIELLGRDGQVRAVLKVQAWPCTIGRSPACDLVLDDAHVAAEHARIELDEQGVARLLLLPSLNGAMLGRRRLAAGDGAVLEPGTSLTLGTTELRLRRASDPLAAELPLAVELRPRHPALLPGLLLLWLCLLGFDAWSIFNAGSRWIDYVAPVLGPLMVLLLWSAGWTLLTQLFQHRLPFLTHLWRASLVIVVLHVANFVVPIVAYALSMPRLLAFESIGFPLGLALMLWWHAALVWPRSRRAVGAVLVGLLLAGLVLLVARRQDEQHLFGPPYLSTLPPPSMRLVSPKPPEALIDALRPLEAELARKASKDRDAEPEADSE
jgi:hypothetical protein